MTANNYAKALYELEIPREDILDAARIAEENPELCAALKNPAVSLAEKHRIIDAVFAPSVRSFIKYLCDRSHSGLLAQITRAYSDYSDKRQGIIRASLVCVEAPSEKQLQGIKSFICKKFGGNEARIDISYDKSLIGGFVLTACGTELDRSLKSSLDGLKEKMKKAYS